MSMRYFDQIYTAAKNKDANAIKTLLAQGACIGGKPPIIPPCRLLNLPRLKAAYQ